MDLKLTVDQYEHDMQALTRTWTAIRHKDSNVMVCSDQRRRPKNSDLLDRSSPTDT
jgi:hypothetical protein